MFYQNQMRYFSAFGKPTSEVTIGVPKETFPNEKRVALSPEAAQRLIKIGFKVNVESGAGAFADFSDEAYKTVGVNIVSNKDAVTSDLILKVRPPTEQEA
jgi:NAD/NADP transhydrogenase alpha subunit